MQIYDWEKIGFLSSRSFVCGYCGNPLASERGWQASGIFDKQTRLYIYICHHCEKATFFDEKGIQTPASVLLLGVLLRLFYAAENF